MLGKRFRRTTSMSQIGPHRIAAGQQINYKQQQQHEQLQLQLYSPAMMSEPLDQAPENPSPWPVPVPVPVPVPSYGYGFNLDANPNEAPGFLQDPSRLVAYQMGLYVHYNNNNSNGSTGSHGLSKLERLDDAGIGIGSAADFLQVCFFCKRRLRHDRNIFIYRGDTAFCSEECRHRQILSDESESLRANSKTETAVAA